MVDGDAEAGVAHDVAGVLEAADLAELGEDRDQRAMKGSPVLIRYADDFVVHCHSRQEALEVKGRLAEWLAPQRLAFNDDKTHRCVARRRL